MKFEVVFNNAVKVFSKLYVGINLERISGADKIPLAFATPYEENQAGRKRQETVNSWIGGTAYDYVDGKHVKRETKNVTRIVENVPRAGSTGVLLS